MHLFAANDDCLLRACKDVGISMQQLQQDVRTIQEWMTQQPHLPAINDSLLVENMLLRCKGSVQKTKKVLDYHLSMRTAAPEFFADRDPLGDELQEIARYWCNTTLSHLTSEGYRVKIYVVSSNANMDLYAATKMWLMQADVSLKEDVNLGEVHIHDMRHLSVGHIKRLTPVLLQKATQLGLNGYKARTKAVHLLNAPPLVNKLVSLLKTVLPAKLTARIHIHSDFESLHKLVERHILPKDFGGDQKPLQELSDDWQMKIESYRDWFLEQEVSGKVDESKRPPNSVNKSSDFFGFEGTFKKLEVD